jgi:DNA-binding transcriptional MerR regulator
MAATTRQRGAKRPAARDSTPAGRGSQTAKGGTESSTSASGAQMTIEQLAHETGMTVRNIRAHQSRGLLPPPEVRARTGYYGPEHVARLRLIQEMQADGFNLGSIKRLVSGTHGAAEEILGFKRVLAEPFGADRPELLDQAELEQRLGTELDSRALAKAERLGILVPLGGGRFEVPSPSLLAAAEGVMQRGVSLPAALAVVEKLRRHCEAVSRAFVKLFLEEVLRPFEQAGDEEARWPEVAESIERLRPIASQALLAVFQQTMTREVESAFGKELERRSKKAR